MVIYFLFPINDGFDQFRNSVIYCMNNYNPVQKTVQAGGYSSYMDQQNVRRYDAILWETMDRTGLPPDVQTFFLSYNNASIDAAYDPDVNCIAYGVNNIYPSHVVGGTQKVLGSPYVPVKWESTGLTYLNTLGGAEGEARSVNDAGDVAGWCKNANGLNRAFLWVKGSTAGDVANPEMLDLGTLGGAESVALSINNLGQIVGWSHDVNGHMHAFLWTPGGTDGVMSNPQMKDLHAIGYNFSVAQDINDQGHIVGYMNNGNDQGFFWQPETGIIELVNLGHSARALSLNINDVITGYSTYTAVDDHHAVTWTFFNITRLDPIVVSSDEWVLTEAADINSQGYIVCNGYEAGTKKSIAVLLTPLIIYPTGRRITVPPLLFFDWLAYRFWWHFPKEFSPEDTKRILSSSSRRKKITEKTDIDVLMPDIAALAQVIESLSLMHNREHRRKIQKLLFGLMIEEVKKML